MYKKKIFIIYKKKYIFYKMFSKDKIKWNQKINVFVLFLVILNKNIMHIYLHIELNETNKCLKNTKRRWKIFFNVFYILTKNKKSETKRKSQKMIKINTMGQGGASVK